MVHKVVVDSAHNRVNGVLYIDRNTREQGELLSRVVILCAQAQESVRILLNSVTREYPNGLANSSGVLGHYLTAHVRSAGGSGEFPSMGAKPLVEGGGPHKPTGVYIARFRNIPIGIQAERVLGRAQREGRFNPTNWRISQLKAN